MLWGVAVFQRDGTPQIVTSCLCDHTLYICEADSRRLVAGDSGGPGNDDGLLRDAKLTQPAGLATSPFARASVFVACLGGLTQGALRTWLPRGPQTC